MQPMKKNSARSWMIISCQCNLADEETCSWIFFQNGTLGLEIENVHESAIRLKASFAADSLLPEHIEYFATNLSKLDLLKQLARLKLKA